MSLPQTIVIRARSLLISAQKYRSNSPKDEYLYLSIANLKAAQLVALYVE